MSQILIIDDEEIIRTAAGRLLERHGYTAVLAASVVEAEQNYSLSSFDLIIADLRLAVGKGTDVIPLCEGV
ncbi:MAG: response regulator, partial [Arenicellales bacterium]|nr:response regulator [Arenicellales bacterium]